MLVTRSFLPVLLLVTSLTTASAFGKIGATEAELVKLYGPVKVRNTEKVGSKTLGEQLTFVPKPWTVRAILIDKKCARINYSKKDQWSQTQLNFLLDLNRNDSAWQETKTKASPIYQRDDGVTAEFQAKSGLTLTDSNYEKQREKLKQALAVKPQKKASHDLDSLEGQSISSPD